MREWKMVVVTTPSMTPGSKRWFFDMLRHQFEDEFSAIESFHRVVGRIVEERFDAAVEEVDYLNPEDHDWGDVYWEAEKNLGINPLDVSAHMGMMSLGRAVALAETTFADIAEKFFVEDAAIVRKASGNSWSREEARRFYSSCLVVPIIIDEGFMGPATRLRDLYAHGYGRPVNEDYAAGLAVALKPYIGPQEPTPEEAKLGFNGLPSVLGDWVTLDESNRLSPSPFLSLRAEVTPLATHRLLQQIKQRVLNVFEAASFGLVEPDKLPDTKFFRERQKKLEREAKRGNN